MDVLSPSPLSGTHYDPQTKETIFVMEIFGEPIALARPRFGGGRAYTIEEQKDAMELQRWDIMNCLRQKNLPISTKRPCRLKLEFYYKSASKKSGPKTTRADLDNLVKWVADTGNKVLWDDDGLIYAISASKHWGPESKTKMQVVWSEK